MADQVFMKHPSIPHTEEQPVEVTRDAFENAWADQGWVETENPNLPEQVDLARYPEQAKQAAAEAQAEADRLAAIAAETGGDSGGTDGGESPSEKKK